MTGLPDIIERRVKLQGFAPIMFDRYAGDNKTQLEPGDKMYFMAGTRDLCIPAINIVSFMSAEKSMSIAKLIGGRSYKGLGKAFLSFTQIAPHEIPLTRNGEPITFNGFRDDRDEQARIYIDRRVARLDKGIPNPKVRPVVEMPWEIEFTLRIFKNDEFDENQLKVGFTKGGIAIGLGTYRGVFGKFLIDGWE